MNNEKDLLTIHETLIGPVARGIYRLKDELGFPLDMAYEECQRLGLSPDWVECALDAGRQSIDKFDSVMAEIKMLEGDNSQVMMVIASGFTKYPNMEFSEACKMLHSRKSKAPFLSR